MAVPAGADEVVRPDTVLMRIFTQQHAQSRAGIAAPWSVRADRLQRLRALLLGQRGPLAAAISADFGQRSRHETELLEITPVLDAIAHSLGHGRRWMRPLPRRPGYKFLPSRGWLLPQPLGVVGIVVPWNYPLFLSLGAAQGALTAGNRVSIKVSELTPRYGALLADLVEKAFAVDEMRVFNGDAAFSRGFCQLPFDHLLFTGSTAVGRHVMRAASGNLTPVTLELGGKSPAIVGPGADFAQAVRRIVVGKMLNAGQTCIAPDYALVPQARLADFADAARSAVGGSTPPWRTRPITRASSRISISRACKAWSMTHWRAAHAHGRCRTRRTTRAAGCSPLWRCPAWNPMPLRCRMKFSARYCRWSAMPAWTRQLPGSMRVRVRWPCTCSSASAQRSTK